MDIDTRMTVKDGDLIVERVQDCVPIAEWSKSMHNEGKHGSSEMKLAARIPNVFIEKYCNDNNLLYSEVMQNREHMRRIVTDPALAHFRIWPGRI
jgi:hypothetical protein